MTRIGIFLFEIFGKFLGKLPKRAIYVLSDFLYLIGFYVIQYRKKVVFENLKNAFPDKPEKEIKTIAKRFFLHLSDVMIENVASLYMKPDKIKNFVTIRNIEVLTNLYKKNKNITALIGHYGNWEFLTTVPPYTSYTVLTVYKPLKNKFFDKKTYEMRERLEAIPIPMKKVYKGIYKYEQKRKPYILGMVADQSPPKREINYWTNFLNQETAFFTGSAKIAKRFNHAVIFIAVHKIERGHYEVKFINLFEDAKEVEEKEIIETYTHTLEQIIREKPEYWLWSHRRWKHK